MRILLLAHSFNSLTQRLWVELEELGHEVSLELDINDSVTREAVALHRPALLLAPFLKRAIPEDVWRGLRCLVFHPGIPGDRGPSALDWAVLEGERDWGLTALQANAEMDAGDIWAAEALWLRPASKSSIYRHEITDAAARLLPRLLRQAQNPGFQTTPQRPAGPGIRGRLRPAMRQRQRRISWPSDTTALVLRKLRCADGWPGVLERTLGPPCYLHGAVAEDTLRGPPGRALATRHGAVCLGTVDGAVWIPQARPRIKGHNTFKLPAAMVLPPQLLEGVPELLPGVLPTDTGRTLREIHYQQRGQVGYLHFELPGGAMSTQQCERLLAAYEAACARNIRVLVLMGGVDFWSNGIHLNLIEHASSPADASLRNIEAINRLALRILNTEDRVTVAALRGNAGAGGVFLALCADRVLARRGVVLNPHYKSMGNLYGAEYWTYSLPARLGPDGAAELSESRLPLGAPRARRLGLIDDCFGEDSAAFVRELEERMERLAQDSALDALLRDKRRRRACDEARRPLAAYNAREMERMRLSFYGFDPSYHIARYNFVHRVPHSRTPLHLARHRL